MPEKDQRPYTHFRNMGLSLYREVKIREPNNQTVETHTKHPLETLTQQAFHIDGYTIITAGIPVSKQQTEQLLTLHNKETESKHNDKPQIETIDRKNDLYFIASIELTLRAITPLSRMLQPEQIEHCADYKPTQCP